jgi:prepilin-type N-terminal cleavage/methylation domain-containing protein
LIGEIEMLNFLHDKRGFTLIELIVVIAIVGLIISMAFSFYVFGSNTLTIGENQSNVQHNVRMAAKYITNELRIARTVEILDEIPDEIDIEPQKNYIFVDGNTIKHIKTEDSIDKDIFHEASTKFSIGMEFKINEDNAKILNFKIDAKYDDQDFEVLSEVLIVNMASTDDITEDIEETIGGKVIVFSNPLTDNEVVNVDAMLLSLKDLNQFLVEGSGILTLLPPPDPNLIRLPINGKNGSDISWYSTKENVINTNGTVLRPGILEADEEVDLTATITKGIEVMTKDFTVIVSNLDPLVINNTTLSPVVEGEECSHIFTASGGEGGYTFTSPDTDLLTDHGLTLEPNGQLSGTATGGSITFTVSVNDEYVVLGPSGPITDPNETTEVVTLAIN